MMCFSVLQTVPSRHGTMSVDEISNGFRRPVWIFQDEVRESQNLEEKGPSIQWRLKKMVILQY